MLSIFCRYSCKGRRGAERIFAVLCRALRSVPTVEHPPFLTGFVFSCQLPHLRFLPNIVQTARRPDKAGREREGGEGEGLDHFMGYLIGNWGGGRGGGKGCLLCCTSWRGKHSTQR